MGRAAEPFDPGQPITSSRRVQVLLDEVAAPRKWSLQPYGHFGFMSTGSRSGEWLQMVSLISDRPSDARAKKLDNWCHLFEGCTRIQELQGRQEAVALGVIQRLRLVPGESMEATITDGTGKLRAVWTGREVLSGLELGRGLRLEGTVCLESGVPVMRNPTWCLVRDPYACSGEA